MKILAVCLDNLGDAINSTSLIEPIKKNLPAAKLFFWIKKDFKELLSNNPLIDGLFSSSPFWLKSPQWQAGTIIEYLKTVGEIKKEHFDCVLIVNACWRKAVSLLFIPIRVGIAQKKSALFLNRKIPAVVISHAHRKQIFASMLAKIGITASDIKTIIRPPLQQEHFLKAFTTRYGLQNKHVFCFHVLSADKTRNWDIGKYASFADELLRNYKELKIVILFGPGEEKQIRSYFIESENIIITPTTLMESTAIIARASFFMGPDSGPLHIASALGTPALSLYDDPPAAKASPMGTGFCDIISRTPLGDITVEEVFNRINHHAQVWKQRQWLPFPLLVCRA